MKAAGESQMRAAYAILDKQERTSAVSAAKEAIIEGDVYYSLLQMAMGST